MGILLEQEEKNKEAIKHYIGALKIYK